MPTECAPLPPEVCKRLTRADCRALEAAGLLESEQYELIDGELVRKMGKSRLHAMVLKALLRWLRRTFGEPFIEHESSIDLSLTLDATNEPEPDAIVLRRATAAFPVTNPGPADLVLVVEVAVTTREYDLGAKAAIYAMAGIADYWVLDLRERRIVVHRNPSGARYASVTAYAADEMVSPLGAEAAPVCLRDLLPAD